MAVNCPTPLKKIKPCFVCGSLDHGAKQCSKVCEANCLDFGALLFIFWIQLFPKAVCLDLFILPPPSRLLRVLWIRRNLVEKFNSFCLDDHPCFLVAAFNFA